MRYLMAGRDLMRQIARRYVALVTGPRPRKGSDVMNIFNQDAYERMMLRQLKEDMKKKRKAEVIYDEFDNDKWDTVRLNVRFRYIATHTFIFAQGLLLGLATGWWLL